MQKQTAEINQKSFQERPGFILIRYHGTNSSTLRQIKEDDIAGELLVPADFCRCFSRVDKVSFSVGRSKSKSL